MLFLLDGGGTESQRGWVTCGRSRMGTWTRKSLSRAHVFSHYNFTLDRQARSTLWLWVGKEKKEAFRWVRGQWVNLISFRADCVKGGQLEVARMAWSPSLGAYDLVRKIGLRKLEVKPHFCSCLCCLLYWVTLGNLLTISGPVFFFC